LETAGIIIIGNEILSGKVTDINSPYLCKELRILGVEVQQIITIPDIPEIIGRTVRDFSEQFSWVFTSGGIGPTHDDITAESISKAFNLNYEMHQEAFNILKKYYKPGEFNEGRQRMAMMPSKANLIYNPTSGAPGFSVENVFCLPGVPSILQSMLPGINAKISGGKKLLTKTINLRTVESEIAKPLKEVQDNNEEVEIGSYPFFRAGKVGVSIVLRSEEESKINICNEQILKFVNQKKIELIQ